MNRAETGINISPMGKVDVGDVSDRGIPVNFKAEQEAVEQGIFRSSESEARKQFIDSMNA